MRNVFYKSLLAVALIPALSLACGDYCDYSSYGGSYDYSYDYSYDSAWSGMYNTGGYDLYSTAYDLYQTTYDLDITTTTYAPIYGSDCSSLSTSCGGGYDNPSLWDPYAQPMPTYPDLGVIPRDPNQPLPLDPYMPIANVPGTPPLGNGIPRDPMNPFFPPIVPPMNPGLPYPPIAQFPPMPPMPPNTWPIPPVVPPVQPPVAGPVTPVPSIPGTPPGGGSVPRDPRTTYNPPTPPPTWGGCDNVVVMCPGGPVTRPTPQIGGTPVSFGQPVPVNNPTVPNVPSTNNSPTHNSPGTAPTRNEVPRGARVNLRSL